MPRKNAMESKKARLAARQQSYDDLCKSRSDNGQGFKRPGSLSGKK